MTDPDPASTVLPYSMIVGQEELRSALEIAYVADAVGGVLATGQRGTAKTTTVRAFTLMLTGELPVTLPIGATDDRVLGGWKIDKLMKGTRSRRTGCCWRRPGPRPASSTSTRSTCSTTTW